LEYDLGGYMTVAVVITILASLLWAITNHIDKFLIDGIDESGSSIKTLLVFSTLIAGMVLSPIWLIASNFSVSIGTISLICVLLASVVYILATLFYFKALEKNDASIIVVMFQMIPVFSYILALILFKENLTAHQIIGSIIIILSAVIISFDFNEKNNRKKFKALLLMTLSSLCYSIYFILFDIGIRNSTYYSCAFWYQIGFLIMGIVLLLLKSFRIPFVNAIKKNGKRYLILNTTNEVINLIANLLVNYANLLIPIALVNVLSGFQGTFAFILGIIGTLLLPKYIKEDLSKRVVIQKIVCIILGIIGLIILVYK
jgi:drug/metabolite transporter (DMT)-like permease